MQMARSALHLIITAQFPERDVEDGQDCDEPEGKETFSNDQIPSSGQDRGRKHRKQWADLRDFPEIELM